MGSAEALRRVGLDDPRQLAAEPLVVADLAAVGHDAVVHGQGRVEEGELAVVLLDAGAAEVAVDPRTRAPSFQFGVWEGDDWPVTLR